MPDRLAEGDVAGDDRDAQQRRADGRSREQPLHQQCRHAGGGELRQDVGRSRRQSDPPGHQQANRHGRVQVAAGDGHCGADHDRQDHGVRQRYSQKSNAAVGKPTVDDDHGGSHEHQREGAECLGDQPTTQRGHAKSFERRRGESRDLL